MQSLLQLELNIASVELEINLRLYTHFFWIQNLKK